MSEAALQGALFELIRHPDFSQPEQWSRQGFHAKDVIIREGDHDHRIYLVERGELAVTSNVALDDNRRVRPGIYTLGPGQIFGEFCLFNDLARTATVTASSDGELIAIDALQLQRFLDDHPELGYRVLRELYSALVVRLDKTNKRVSHLLAWGLKAHGIDQHL